jgi:hypothetical protein
MALLLLPLLLVLGLVSSSPPLPLEADVATAGGVGVTSSGNRRQQIMLARVSNYSRAPDPFIVMDWHGRSAALDAFVTGPIARAAGFAWWTEDRPSPLLPAGSASPGISSYANDTVRNGLRKPHPLSSEGLPVFGAVLGAETHSLVSVSRACRV